MNEQTTEATTTVDATGTNSGAPFVSFNSEKDFQDAIDKRLAERLERERKKTETATAKAREEAEAKALADQAKFQELADKRGAKLTELETATADLTGKLESEAAKALRYEKALTAMLAEQRKRVPEHLHGLLDKLPVDEQLTWIASNGDKLAGATGVPATPKPTGLLDADKEKAQASATQFYRNKF